MPKEPPTAANLWKRLTKVPLNVVVLSALIGIVVVSVGIVNGYIWSGRDNAVRAIIAQTLEADLTGGLVVLGAFLILQELWRRFKDPPRSETVLGEIVRGPDGALLVKLREEGPKEP